jgi:hypothetical protein
MPAVRVHCNVRAERLRGSADQRKGVDTHGFENEMLTGALNARRPIARQFDVVVLSRLDKMSDRGRKTGGRRVTA